MKYDFKLKHLGFIEDQKLLRLKSLILAVNYSKGYFADLNNKLLVSEDLTRNNPLIRDLIETSKPLSDLFDPKYFVSASIDFMPPDSYLQEHVDSSKSLRVLNEHKLHIPIKTAPQVGFMWRGHASVERMVEGGIYAFNNIDPHSVVNLSQIDRYHLILRYKGEAWEPTL